MLTVLDLFSGIGGFSYGLERLCGGFQTIAFCEIEPYCQKILRQHWPDVPICDDITQLNGNDYATVDLVCGGFPCQPWSLAGKQRGTADDRDLWPEMRRVIAQASPEWIIAENVAALDDAKFMALDRVLADLDTLDYEATPIEIPACSVNAPHLRNRVWIVAHSAIHRPQRERIPDRSERADYSNLAGFDWCGEYQTCVDGKQRRVPESGVRLLANGIPNRVHQIKALGNSVVPQVVARLGEAILASYDDTGAKQ